MTRVGSQRHSTQKKILYSILFEIFLYIWWQSRSFAQSTLHSHFLHFVSLLLYLVSIVQHLTICWPYNNPFHHFFTASVALTVFAGSHYLQILI